VTVIGPDTVVCVVEGTDIPYERTLLELGARDVVDQGRTRLQHHIAEQMIGVIQSATQRTVRGHVPGYSARCDAATETFLLAHASDR
jgi:hypothetical protein